MFGEGPQPLPEKSLLGWGEQPGGRAEPSEHRSRGGARGAEICLLRRTPGEFGDEGAAHRLGDGARGVAAVVDQLRDASERHARRDRDGVVDVQLQQSRLREPGQLAAQLGVGDLPGVAVPTVGSGEHEAVQNGMPDAELDVHVPARGEVGDGVAGLGYRVLALEVLGEGRADDGLQQTFLGAEVVIQGRRRHPSRFVELARAGFAVGVLREQ